MKTHKLFLIFHELFIHKYIFDGHKLYKPNKISKEYEFYTCDFSLRALYNTYFSWSVVSIDAINQIKEFVNDDLVLSIMSGSGLWELPIFLQKIVV